MQSSWDIGSKILSVKGYASASVQERVALVQDDVSSAKWRIAAGSEEPNLRASQRQEVTKPHIGIACRLIETLQLILVVSRRFVNDYPIRQPIIVRASVILDCVRQ